MFRAAILPASTLLLALLGACAPAAPTPTTPTSVPANQGGDPAPSFRLELSQGPCMGRCPIFEVSVGDDGALTFIGTANVAVAGEQHRQLDAATLAELIQAFAEARFFDLDDDGDLPREPQCTTVGNTTQCTFADSIGCSDTSHTVITYRLEDRERTLDDPHCQDTALSRLEDRVIPLLGIAPWIDARAP
ncbi:MAG: hypothetical protein H6709_11440 [Kofleriaceae bacterium]|nr:hypothetical protein [Kofleriaceae bacterium]MCB9572688.1 hypothetical protein [Kofleriaceae bacterium]